MKSSYQARLALPSGISFDVTWETDATVDMVSVGHYVDTLNRPGWYTHDFSNQKDTRLYMLEVYQPFQTINLNGTLTRSWKCEKCHGIVLYEGVHLGHKTKWKDELKSAGVKTASEAKAAYNNLRNLRIECAGCNQSHAFE
jgi:hypothetical protein